MASIAYALGRIKGNPLHALDRQTIERVCRECNHQWRARDLDPATTVALLCRQVALGNVACSELRRAAGAAFSLQAYCAARARLPLGVVQGLLTAVVDAALPQTRRAAHLWLGRHRTFHVDGSSFSMPDTTELGDAFGTPSGQAEGCGFPTAHLLVLFSAATGLLLDAFAGPLNTGDVAQTPELYMHLDAGDVVVGDDSFSGYAHLALLAKRGLHGLFPVHHRRIVDFTKGRPHALEGDAAAVAGMPTSRWVKSLGREDQLVEYFKPRDKPAWMSRAEYDALPASVLVRELRRTVQRPGAGKVTLTLVTTLTDPAACPAADLLDLRLRRWDVETNIGAVKTTMGMDVLRCKTEEGVRKEVAAFCLVYNLVRCVMLEAARRQDAPVARVSFADALYWVRHARPGDALPALTVNPLRPGRAEPRSRKRRPKPFPLMKQARHKLRKALKNSGKTG